MAEDPKALQSGGGTRSRALRLSLGVMSPGSARSKIERRQACRCGFPARDTRCCTAHAGGVSLLCAISAQARTLVVEERPKHAAAHLELRVAAALLAFSEAVAAGLNGGVKDFSWGPDRALCRLMSLGGCLPCACIRRPFSPMLLPHVAHPCGAHFDTAPWA
jgi:hypothetical protein